MLAAQSRASRLAASEGTLCGHRAPTRRRLGGCPGAVRRHPPRGTRVRPPRRHLPPAQPRHHGVLPGRWRLAVRGEQGGWGGDRAAAVAARAAGSAAQGRRLPHAAPLPGRSRASAGSWAGSRCCVTPPCVILLRNRVFPAALRLCTCTSRAGAGSPCGTRAAAAALPLRRAHQHRARRGRVAGAGAAPDGGGRATLPSAGQASVG